MYCPGCKRADLTEADFGKDRSNKRTGLQSCCRPCCRQQANAWRAAHLEAEREADRRFYQNHTDQEVASWRRWEQKNPEKMREYTHKRNALLRTVEAEEVHIREVFNRDNWTCQLCGVVVDSALRYPDPLAASLDHVIPLSKGGTHTYENVQLAHWICNMRKGARISIR